MRQLSLSKPKLTRLNRNDGIAFIYEFIVVTVHRFCEEDPKTSFSSKIWQVGARFDYGRRLHLKTQKTGYMTVRYRKAQGTVNHVNVRLDW